MHRFSGLRRAQFALAMDEQTSVAFPVEGPGRRTEVLISELNRWPAFSPLPDAQHDRVAALAPPLEAIAAC